MQIQDINVCFESSIERAYELISVDSFFLDLVYDLKIFFLMVEEVIEEYEGIRVCLSEIHEIDDAVRQTWNIVLVQRVSYPQFFAFIDDVVEIVTHLGDKIFYHILICRESFHLVSYEVLEFVSR